MGTYVRFECLREDKVGPTYGPYEWVQLTYDTLRVGPDGNELAGFIGDWYLSDQEHEQKDQAWSDVVIFNEP